MITREILHNDLRKVDALWEKYHSENFGLPPISQTVFSQLVEHNGQLICVGIVQLIPEAIIVMNLEAEIEEKVIAIESLLKNGGDRLLELEYEQLHAFIQEPIFINFLKKRHHFKDVKGSALVKMLRE